MTTLSAQPPVRAHLIARLWTWIVSIALSLAAFPVGFGGVWGVRNWRALIATYGDMHHPSPLLDLPILRTYPAMWIGLFCWAAAWGLHVHASRQRRMHPAHAVIPAIVFLLSLIGAFVAPPFSAPH
jgi:hypothetical protein